MKLGNDLNTIKEKYQSLTKELNTNTHLLEDSKERYHSLEREFHLLKEERDSLLQTVSSSSQTLEQVTNEKEKVWQDLNTEVQRRKDLEEEIKQFGITFASRQKSLISFHSDLRSKLENFKAQNPVSIPKSLGSAATTAISSKLLVVWHATGRQVATHYCANAAQFFIFEGGSCSVISMATLSLCVVLPHFRTFSGTPSPLISMESPSRDSQ
ncbi:hypothetical protein TEA_016971 [Camellia sinensis var. sinensis]|uniref:Uncharacterized protein n=1 Tax=Camellia sinensis var. sinensis TaxID=542762 RepID=A0A4S4D1Y6_CAMSN|nr:hypothetical protein TEA_016971 [Camellia sinensis var. sinensis]